MQSIKVTYSSYSFRYIIVSLLLLLLLVLLLVY